jgi:excisionase family DNA binding protein
MSEQEEEYLTSTEAMELLGVSQGKMTSLLKSGEFATYTDPGDKRLKLIKKADVEAWLARRVRKRNPYRRREKPATSPHEGIEQTPAA